LISTGIQLDYGSLYLSSTGKRHGFLLKVKEAMLIASRGTQMTISRDSDVPEFEIQTIFGSINVRDFLSHGSMNLSRGDALTSRGRFHIDHFHLFPFLPAKTELIWQRFWDYDWTSTLARQGDDLEQRNSRIYRRKAKEIDYRYHLNRQSKPHEENRDSVHYFYTESAPKRPYQERRDWQHPFGRTRK
jgi:hypothetical protein